MIAALILAAGQAKRMGQPKMLLPWGNTTVLGQVIATMQAAGVERIVVITGSAREEVETLVEQMVRQTAGSSADLCTVYNEHFAEGEMLSSVQAGLRHLAEREVAAQAALIAPGDQPQVQERSVRSVMQAYREQGATLVVPSFHRRRGHPWLAARSYWEEILCLQPPASLRDFLRRHAEAIRYVEVEDAGVLQDLDTPEDYLKLRP
jgi:molybdenum cofactor cytidylyltransferase